MPWQGWRDSEGRGQALPAGQEGSTAAGQHFGSEPRFLGQAADSWGPFSSDSASTRGDAQTAPGPAAGLQVDGMCVKSAQGKVLPLNRSGLHSLGFYRWEMTSHTQGARQRAGGRGKAQDHSRLSKPRAGNWVEGPLGRGLGQGKGPPSGLGQMAGSLLRMPQHREVWPCSQAAPPSA